MSHYGKKSVFRDIDNVPIGVDFRTHIGDVLQHSDILFAVVGPNWRGPQPDGHAQIDEENDLVRIEVETALKEGIPVIPLLVGDADMPTAEQLPEALKAFSYRNATRVDGGQDFDHHLDRLIRKTDAILKSKIKGPRRYAVAGLAAALVLLLALGGLLYWLYPRGDFPQTPWLAVANDEIGEEEIAGPENNPRVLDYISAVKEHARGARRRDRLGLGLRRVVAQPGRPRGPSEHGAERLAQMGQGHHHPRAGLHHGFLL